MATLLRLLWSIAVGFVVGYFVPSPWCWIWIGVIVAAWIGVFIVAGVVWVYSYAIDNGWPLRRL
ncbi:MAG TPA: hypothetical protein VK577_03625 [Bradyrhizobium sp.]|nr:hypothetical protein [Bradyrhizobium sp.]